MTKKGKRNILFVQPHGQQENTSHLFSENMGKDSWSGCQDKAVGKKAFIASPANASSYNFISTLNEGQLPT